MARLEELRRANAQIEEQMEQWKKQRYANGENPLDWAAFREHLLAIGAPDPGESAPDEFYRWDESLIGGTPDRSSPTA